MKAEIKNLKKRNESNKNYGLIDISYDTKMSNLNAQLNKYLKEGKDLNIKLYNAKTKAKQYDTKK